MPPQSKLRIKDNPEKIKGIWPVLGKGLKGLGITNVAELIAADPTIIHEKTHVSRNMVERFQTNAQLLMILGVEENDAELLVDAGIASRKELANQDLIRLSRKIGKITKNHIEEGKMSKDENPTAEEIWSWIRMAKYF